MRPHRAARLIGAAFPVAAALGAFLRALHVVPAEQLAPASLPTDPLRRGWPRARADDNRVRLRQLVDAGTWTGDPTVVALLAEAERLDEPAGPPVPVHGDLHVRQSSARVRSACG